MTDAEALILGESNALPPVVTPSGLEIVYCPEPRYYKVQGIRVPSVTEVLSVLHKPALTWWGMKVGVEGVLELARQKEFDPLMPSEYVVDLLTSHKLTVNHVRDKAGTRGTSVHNALERFTHTGSLPIVEDFPEEEQGYVRGLCAFLEAVDLQPMNTELMVGSAEHGFAGRFDLDALTDAKEVKPTPRKTRQIPRGRGIWDLKTSKSIYPESHYLQLAGYRGAMEESGYGRSEYEGIINVRADGSWDVGISTARYEDFLAVVRAHRVLKTMKGRK